MRIHSTRGAVRTLSKELNLLYGEARRMTRDLTDLISTTRLINHFFGELCAAPAKSRSSITTKRAYADTSRVRGVAEIPNHSEPSRRRRCRTGFKFEPADMLRKRSA
jgi:hypothetical protein